MAFNTFDSSHLLPPYQTLRIEGDGTEDGFLMARAWETQGKSTVKLPGQAANRCWRMTHARVGFSSVLPMDLMARARETQGKSTWEDYDKQTGQGEELGESCWHAGKIWPISPGSLKDNVGMAGMDGTVKTSMRSGKTSDMVFLNELKPSDVRLLPLHLGKSSPIKACTDYGCLETQGKQWACISGLPAMGTMAIERGE
ncbi:hypothetical protein HO173_007861 [Letharia columbiana]|uniref:Uncharacterized protein n=1 Tax=Letharia columbiana TaxID=112416 RepID=A0A8H6FSR1_9LECA|nr:uncharacterized protein HO173_007861 [Letharia columbiana]KAF6234031.1 hypothetical protein HO173_007861 [Letharia columbiana]